MNTPPLPDHYQILGLTPDATVEEIHRRFRELARRWHPDIRKTPEATERFQEINEAHRILSDPVCRAQYDSERILQNARNARLSASSNDEYSRESGKSSKKDHPASTASSSARSYSSANSRHPSQQDTAEVLLSRAQRAFGRLSYREAESLCRQILRMNRRSAKAYELLGDIRRAGGRIDEALAMYSYALQLDANNVGLRSKFERAAGRNSVKSVHHTHHDGSSRKARQSIVVEETGGLWTRNAILLIGLTLAVYLSLSVAFFPAILAPDFLIWHWDSLLLFTLFIGGMLGGLLIALYERPTSSQSESRFISLLILTTILSLVSFYLALLAAVAHALIIRCYSRRILKFFGAAGITFIVLASCTHTGYFRVFLLGGNISYPSVVIGSLIARKVRSGG
jgi:curved DNA-binding protein CbpA